VEMRECGPGKGPLWRRGSVAPKRACCGDERVWPWKGPVVESRECSPEKGLLWRRESVALERARCGDEGV